MFVSLVVISAPISAFAADQWNETPQFSHDSQSDTASIESSRFNYKTPTIDKWAETPDLSAVSEDHGVIIDRARRLVDHFNPEMYAETPELS